MKTGVKNRTLFTNIKSEKLHDSYNIYSNTKGHLHFISIKVPVLLNVGLHKNSNLTDSPVTAPTVKFSSLKVNVLLKAQFLQHNGRTDGPMDGQKLFGVHALLQTRPASTPYALYPC